MKGVHKSGARTLGIRRVAAFDFSPAFQRRETMTTSHGVASAMVE